jgi:DNA adenine methylase
MSNLKPFFKCPGGKRKLVPTILKEFPKGFFENKKSKYAEPFLGGGALALTVMEKMQGDRKDRILLNEFNPYVTQLWNSVSQKAAAQQLINSYEYMLETQAEYVTKETTEEQGQYFYEVRQRLYDAEDTIRFDPAGTSDFLFLNKHAFNGLIRFNNSGKYNAPYGKYKTPQKIDKANLLKISELMEEGEVWVDQGDFEDTIKEWLVNGSIDSDTLFYFDPPYVPLKPTSNFTQYSKGGFTKFDQHRLRSMVDYLNDLGAKFILSNSATDLVRELYSKYNMIEIKAARSINSVGSKRGKISEYLIKNF